MIDEFDPDLGVFPRLKVGKRFRGKRIDEVPTANLSLVYPYLDRRSKLAARAAVLRRPLPFGMSKENDTPLADLPTWYISWVLRKIQLYPPLLASVVVEELERREAAEQDQQDPRAWNMAQARQCDPAERAGTNGHKTNGKVKRKRRDE